MNLMLSFAARDRKFSKAIIRIYQRIKPLEKAFTAVGMQCPIHEAILVMVTDDMAPGLMNEVRNVDGFFQISAGCELRDTDEELLADVFEILLKAVRLCPFVPADLEKFERLFEEYRPLILGK